jgi:uncharacterized membrane protein YhhN
VTTPLLIGLCALATGWLVLGTRSAGPSRFIAKPVASLAFLLVAATRAPTGARGWLIVAGLILGAIGDVALMWDTTGPFLFGLASFLLGHLAYVAAFARDTSAVPLAMGVLAATALGTSSLRWLHRHLVGPFRVAVPAYTIVICLMVAAAVGSVLTHPLAAIGAALFAASDLLVARQRFVTADPLNPTVGLPLYYLGQLLIALSI